MKRLLAAISVGSVLMAGAYGFAQSQTFGSGGIAAQGAAAAVACDPTMTVQYVQTAGVVTGIDVNQAPGGNCAGLAFNVVVRDAGNLPLATSSGVVNGADAVVAISNVAAIDNALVTITNQ